MFSFPPLFFLLLVLEVLLSHYGSCSSVTVAGSMVEEPAKQFIAAPTLLSVGNSNSTSDVHLKQFESSFCAVTSQFSLPFLDSVIDSLRKLLRKEALLDSECHNLGMLMEMANLHQNLHYGHPIHNRKIGHDILNAVGYQGSDIVHAVEAMGPIMIQGAEQNTVHIETKKVPSTIHGTERSHVDKDSSMDAGDQPYKKMRSSIHHSNTREAKTHVSDHSNPSMSSRRHHSTVS
jgi:hypothetical protein